MIQIRSIRLSSNSDISDNFLVWTFRIFFRINQTHKHSEHFLMNIYWTQREWAIQFRFNSIAKLSLRPSSSINFLLTNWIWSILIAFYLHNCMQFFWIFNSAEDNHRKISLKSIACVQCPLYIEYDILIFFFRVGSIVSTNIEHAKKLSWCWYSQCSIATKHFQSMSRVFSYLWLTRRRCHATCMLILIDFLFLYFFIWKSKKYIWNRSNTTAQLLYFKFLSILIFFMCRCRPCTTLWDPQLCSRAFLIFLSFFYSVWS